MRQGLDGRHARPVLELAGEVRGEGRGLVVLRDNFLLALLGTLLGVQRRNTSFFLDLLDAPRVARRGPALVGGPQPKK